jgi:hypothetical protein
VVYNRKKNLKRRGHKIYGRKDVESDFIIAKLAFKYQGAKHIAIGNGLDLLALTTNRFIPLWKRTFDSTSHFVEANGKRQLAFDAHHHAPNGPMIEWVAQEDIARLNASQTRFEIAIPVHLANIPKVFTVKSDVGRIEKGIVQP